MNDNNLLAPTVRRSDAVKNHALILDTARRLFSEQGVEVVSMTAIADAAGVGKGTLYRHFENKIELIVALLDADQRALQTRTLQHLALPDAPAEKLCWFLEEVVRFVVQNEALLFGAIDFVPPLHHPAHFWWRQTIYGLLRQINPRGDLDFVSDTLYVLIDVRTIQYLLRARGYTVERILAAIHDTVAHLIN